MSCLQPISIINPSTHYKSDMPVNLRVPCGNCAECRRIKQDEWFFRGVIEFLHYKKIGGATYFITLTYNDQHLPYLSLINKSSGEVCQVVKCFSARHIRNFIKYFRMLLKKNGYEWKGMKYLVCSEYGEHTQRPHYHLLLHLPFKLPINTLIRLLRQAWPHGFISRSEQGFEVYSHKGIRYVMKYISKDMDFFKQSAWFGSDVIDTDLDEFKDSLPRHWQSMHYGESFIDDVILKSRDPVMFLINNQYSLPIGDGIRSIYSIPRYYHYKLENKVNKEYTKELGRVYLEKTDIGKQVSTLRYAKSILYDMAYLRTLRRDVLENTFPDQNCIKLCGFDLSRLYSESKDYSVEDYSGYVRFREFLIDSILAGLDRFDKYMISVYRLFLRNYPLVDGVDPMLYFHDVGSLIARSVVAPSIPPEVLDSDLCFLTAGDMDQVSTPLRDIDKRDVNRIKTFSMDYRFRDLEHLCYCLDFFEYFCNKNKSVVLKIKKDSQTRVKSLFGNKYKSFNSLTS